MQMSDLCLIPTRPASGFTLLEILLVLLLLGLVSSLIVPRVGVIYDNLVLRGEREELLRAVQALPVDALTRRSDIVAGFVEATGAQLLSVPDGWDITFSENLVFKANGFCTGGAVRLTHSSERVWRYRLPAPYCEPELQEDES